MKKVKVLLNFIRFSLALKLEFYRNVIACLTDNELFANPDVELTVLNDAVTKFASDYKSAKTGNHEAVVKMRQSEKVADDLFRKVANYVDRIADGDEAIILNAGFNGTRQPTSSKKALFSADYGDNPCEIVLKCKAVPGAYSYTWQYSVGILPDKDENWTFAGTSTQVSFLVSNLTPLTKHWFRVCAVKADGMQPWSNPIMKVVL